MQTASQIPPTPPRGLGKLSMNDFWKSLLLAALSNVLLGLYPILNSGAFPTKTDLIFMARSTVAIVISYLLKNLGTNNVGELLKKDEPVVPVGVQKLEDLKQQTIE